MIRNGFFTWHASALCPLPSPQAVAAEAAAAKAEEVAAAAMRAAEAAVKDEMQAAAVVRETQVGGASRG